MVWQDLGLWCSGIELSNVSNKIKEAIETLVQIWGWGRSGDRGKPGRTAAQRLRRATGSGATWWAQATLTPDLRVLPDAWSPCPWPQLQRGPQTSWADILGRGASRISVEQTGCVNSCWPAQIAFESLPWNPQTALTPRFSWGPRDSWPLEPESQAQALGAAEVGQACGSASSWAGALAGGRSCGFAWVYLILGRHSRGCLSS